jgi:hypothetical protein
MKNLKLPICVWEIGVSPVPDILPEYEAVFIWNNGELNSMLDYEVPIVGRGSSEAEAIGNLILELNKKSMHLVI